jgi:ribosome-associated protein
MLAIRLAVFSHNCTSATDTHEMMNEEPELPDEEEAPLRPSRSARKRDAEARQRLGVRLVGLREARLMALNLGLPEALLDAIREARNIRKGPGLARQYQYIGKLMREIDPEPIEAALEQVEGGWAPRAKIPR